MDDTTLHAPSSAVQANDALVQDLWSRQIKEGPNAGGQAHDSGLAMQPTGFLRAGIASLRAHGSLYEGDKKLAQALAQAADFLLRRQHEDGTVSMLDCNFHSPPDLAFVVLALGPAAELTNASEALRPVAKRLQLFHERAAPALLEGGIHTPNHRWVMVAALSWLKRLLGGDEFLARAKTWLAEGIDLHGDGDWTERSHGLYSEICDRAFITAAINFDMPQLLEPPRQHLRALQYLVHPNGEVVTDYSHRQDRGARVSLARYAQVYRWMASLDGDPLFEAMARWAVQLGGVEHLLERFVFPKLHRQVEPSELPTRYRILLNTSTPPRPDPPRVFHYDRPRKRYVPGARVWRLRNDDLSITVASECPEFLSFRWGPIHLSGLRIVPAFFGWGPLTFPILRADGDAIILEQTCTAWYNGPLPKEHAAGADWTAMPHELRPRDHHRRMHVRLALTPEPDKLVLRLAVESEDPVPLQFVYRFAQSGQVEAEKDAVLKPLPMGEKDQAGGQKEILLESGMARYVQEGYAVEIGPGGAEHLMQQLRGDEPRRGTDNLLINRMAPLEDSFVLRFDKL